MQGIFRDLYLNMTTPTAAPTNHSVHEGQANATARPTGAAQKKTASGKRATLTDLRIKTATPKKTQYKLSDFGNLYLLVKPNGSKLWQWAYKIAGRSRVYSIGPYPEVSLQDARTARDEARKLQKQGIDPTGHRREKKREAEARVDQHSLRDAYSIWFRTEEGKLAKKTSAQRKREIEGNLPAALLDRPMASISRPELVSLLDRIATRAPSVAQNVRQYLNGIFELAINRGNMTSNPVPPSGILSAPKTKSHAALMGERLGDFLLALETTNRAQAKTKVAMLLLLYSILRKNEATGARWSEFNLITGDWLVSGDRMKERIDHWIPLPRQAVQLLKEWKSQSPDRSDFLFPNRDDRKRPMAGNTLNALMNKTGFKGEGTPHGLRSAFSTHFNQARPEYADVIEKALSHQPKDEVRAAYNRYQYREERRQILQEWADQLDKLRDEAASRAASALGSKTNS